MYNKIICFLLDHKYDIYKGSIKLYNDSTIVEEATDGKILTDVNCKRCGEDISNRKDFFTLGGRK